MTKEAKMQRGEGVEERKMRFSESDAESKQKISVLVVGASPETVAAFDELALSKKELVTVDYTSTGMDGIEKVKLLKPDIVFFSGITADMNHVDFVPAARKTNSLTRIVLMSGSNDPVWIRRGLLAGADTYLSEPPDLEGLQHTIYVVLSSTLHINRKGEVG